MTGRHVIFVPGKNPKPPAEQHRRLLWRALLEGMARAEPDSVEELARHADDFTLIAWNYLFYQDYKDISRDLPWIDALINKHGPTQQDMEEADAWHRRVDRLVFNIADRFPFIIRLLPRSIRMTAQEINRYFENHADIACQIRELLKEALRPMLSANDKVLLIGHSLGSVIAYDTLWELSHAEHQPGVVDLFLTLGSPLGMKYVQRRLMGSDQTGTHRYPTNIRHWVNISAVGDLTALDRRFASDFADMLELGVVESIVDHCTGIYTFFRNEQGLNCHRSYGYLVHPAVGKVVADWWRAT